MEQSNRQRPVFGSFGFGPLYFRKILFSKLFILVVYCLLPVQGYQFEIPNCGFKNECYQHGSSWWKRHATYCFRCSIGKVYHCARDYDYPNNFREGCAIEKICLAGEEPYLSFLENQIEIKEPIVYCRICEDINTYNDRDRLSSTFSLCPYEKQDCSQGKHKILCIPETSKEDRFCRCDARKGYYPINDDSNKRCSYKNYECEKYECPPTANGKPQQRLLNYTCAPNCQDGYGRLKEDFDTCELIPRKISTTITPAINITTSDTTDSSKNPVKDCAEACKIDYSVCRNGTCVCLDTSTCPSVYRPVCGYNSESNEYKTFDTECKLLRTFCKEKKFHLKHHSECEKKENASDKHLIIIIAVVAVVFIGVFCVIHKLRKKCRDNGRQSPADDNELEERESLQISPKLNANTSVNGDGRNQLNGNPVYAVHRNGSADGHLDRQVPRRAPLAISEVTRTPQFKRNSGPKYDKGEARNGEGEKLLDSYSESENEDSRKHKELTKVEEKSKKYLIELLEFMKIARKGRTIGRDKRFEMFVNMCTEMKSSIPELTSELLISQQHMKYHLHEMIYWNTPKGYKAYASSGEEKSCLYQSVSLLLSGSEDLQYSLRLLTTLHAVSHFRDYKQRLLHLGNTAEYWKIFFDHSMVDKSFKEISKLNDDAETIIDACLKVLVMETARIGTDSSVLHVSFLCGALGINIQHHFQNKNTVYSKKKEDVPWMKYLHDDIEDVTIPDLHLFWVNHSNNESGKMNHIVPLLKVPEDAS